jgi:hypothetical protein
VSNLAQITADPDVMSSRTGRLRGVSFADVVKVLGFQPNVDDDESKVKHSWGFRVNGSPCAIWDYYGTQWSCDGEPAILRDLFGDKYTAEQG